MGAETSHCSECGGLLKFASMRPRHDGRGNSVLRVLNMLAIGCFNEAAPRWARKRPSSSHLDRCQGWLQ